MQNKNYNNARFLRGGSGYKLLTDLTSMPHLENSKISDISNSLFKDNMYSGFCNPFVAVSEKFLSITCLPSPCLSGGKKEKTVILMNILLHKLQNIIKDIILH